MPENAKPQTVSSQEVPKLYRGQVEKAAKSRTNAMRVMCLQCVGWKRKDVTDCSDQTCPLWTWRPYQEKS